MKKLEGDALLPKLQCYPYRVRVADEPGPETICGLYTSRHLIVTQSSSAARAWLPVLDTMPSGSIEKCLRVSTLLRSQPRAVRRGLSFRRLRSQPCRPGRPLLKSLMRE